MAAPGTRPSSSTGGAVFVALLAATLLLLLAAEELEASSFIAYKGPGCSGKAQRISKCGVCKKIAHHGGYTFVFTGQQAALLGSARCLSEPGLLPSNDTSSCFPFTDGAVAIRCN